MPIAWRSKRASLLLVASVWIVMWHPGIIFGGYLCESATWSSCDMILYIRIVVHLNLGEEGKLVGGETKADVAVSVSR
jgi:hypothetical protein